MGRSGWHRLPVGFLAALVLFGLAEQPAPATVRKGSPVASSNDARGAPLLHVIPFPGTPDASPGAPIIFSSLTPGELRSVVVTGSRSGIHGGRLEALPDGAGTEFVPRRSFTPGERVSVSAALSSPAAGTASGDQGSTRLRFSFGVAVTRTGVPAPSDGSPPPAAAVASSHSFHSAPGLRPPAVSASANPDTQSGDIFLTPAHTHQKGPMILNSRGQLVWFRPVEHAVAFNLEVQSYRGRPVLTWWQGRYGKGGEDLIVNRSYHTVAALRAVGYQTDPHDFEIAPHGTAWLLARTAVQTSLAGIGGPSNGYVWDTVVQKVDIATGKLLWEWHAYGHIPLTASYKGPQSQFCDCYHLNAVQQLSDGSLLISSRSTWAVYKVSTKTGKILWTLGGKYSNFKMGPGTRFEWQHDAHREGNTLTVFDDAAHPQEEPQSSAKILHINVPAKTVSLVKRFTHNPPLLTPAQGSVQILPNGNVFVGWGSDPHFSEYAPGGKQIFTASFPLGTTSYRAFRFPWSGHPDTRPLMAVSPRTKGGAHVWASWNGATNVARWRVLGGPSPSQLHAVRTRPTVGFETRVALPTRPAYVEVQALNYQGKVLGTSAPHHLG